jgi:hypothetical protein
MSPGLRNALGILTVAAATTTGVLSPSGGPKRAEACASCYAVGDGCYADCSNGGRLDYCTVIELQNGCWTCDGWGNCGY